MQGVEVHELQEELVDLAIALGTDFKSQSYGQETAKAVCIVQALAGIRVDGRPGRRHMLRSDPRAGGCVRWV